MIFKNAIHLLIGNFGLVFKFLLYMIIVLAVALALSAAFVYPTLDLLLSSEEFSAVLSLDLAGEFFGAAFSGNGTFFGSYSEPMQAALRDLGPFLAENVSSVVKLAVAVAAIGIVVRFLFGLGNFAFGSLIDRKMSSNAKLSFSGVYIRNLGRAALWHVVYVPLTFVYDLLVLAICYLFFAALLHIIAVRAIASAVALMLSVALFLASQAVKLTLFSHAVPAMVTDGQGLRRAFAKSFAFKGQKRFGPLFSTYLVTVILIMCVNVLCALATFGAALFITVPVSYLIMLCVQFVGYYTFEKRKYFLSEDTVISPKEEKTHENFYDDFDEV